MRYQQSLRNPRQLFGLFRAGRGTVRTCRRHHVGGDENIFCCFLRTYGVYIPAGCGRGVDSHEHSIRTPLPRGCGEVSIYELDLGMNKNQTMRPLPLSLLTANLEFGVCMRNQRVVYTRRFATTSQCPWCLDPNQAGCTRTLRSWKRQQGGRREDHHLLLHIPRKRSSFGTPVQQSRWFTRSKF